MFDRQACGERLRLLRGEKSREEVAVAIGVTAMAVWNYENGTRRPSDEIKCRIADYFNTTVQELFYE